MNEIVNYKIITGLSNVVENKVLSYLRQGWELSGGISKDGNFFSQAIFLRKKSKEEDF